VVSVPVLLWVMIPRLRAACLSDASLSKTPYRRNGSASPRNADPIALIASCGDVLLNEERSEASLTKSIENF
jgi:hypothetical protein